MSTAKCSSRDRSGSRDDTLPTLPGPESEEDHIKELKDMNDIRTKDFGFLPIPRRLRFDPQNPPEFTTLLNYTFGFGGTFIVMNLYYNQPILIDLSIAFGVTYERVSRIPTLVQAGYACGLFLIAPLGDLVHRRPLILLIVFLGAVLTIPVALTRSVVIFETISFLIGFLSVCPQIFVPLAADLAPPHKRAAAISIVLSGLLFGILLARMISGVITQFVTYRVVYYLAIGLQSITLVTLYFVLPDYPAKNEGTKLSYFGILTSLLRFAATEPTLIQACLAQFAASACFSNYWVTLTFLLGGPPYNYNTLVIGLFGLVGMFGVAMGPPLGHVVDRLVPWYASLVGTFIQVIFQAVQTAAGGINISAVIITCFGLDVGRQMQQVSLTSSVYSVDPSARSRLNAILIICIFLGMVMGTSVGTQLFVEHGWRAASGFSMALFGFQFFVLLVRGPHVSRFTWFGYEGGLEARKKVADARKSKKTDGKDATDISRQKAEMLDEKENAEPGVSSQKDNLGAV